MQKKVKVSLKNVTELGAGLALATTCHTAHSGRPGVESAPRPFVTSLSAPTFLSAPHFVYLKLGEGWRTGALTHLSLG